VTVERDDEVVGGSRGSGLLVGMCPRGRRPRRGGVTTAVARPAGVDPNADDASGEKRAERRQRCPDGYPAGSGDTEPEKTTLLVMFATKTWPSFK
jgi:hypothetical protein